MKTNIFNNVLSCITTMRLLLRRTLVLSFLFAAILITIISCHTKKKELVQKITTNYYTCSMHPQIMKPLPGKCPICGMQLIVVQKIAAANDDEIKLTNQQMILGNIYTDTIKNGSVGDQLALTATLNFNQNKTSSVSSRVAGRIEKLYFKTIGAYLKKGDKLFDIYSEELNNAKQEYLLSLEQKITLGNATINFDKLIRAAKNKLLLWGLSEIQIIELEKNKQAKTASTFYSNSSGYITSMDIKEGDYVMDGGTIVRLANLESLWVEAQVYSSQLSYINRKAIATVQITDMPEKIFEGTIEFVNPEIIADTRINLIRISIPNKNNQLKPGMPAHVFIKNPTHNSLMLPADAVLHNASGAMVWVQTSPNVFKSKMVETGLEINDMIEIKSGLRSNEIVVTSGAYLLNSEYIFKKGINPMEGMKM